MIESCTIAIQALALAALLLVAAPTPADQSDSGTVCEAVVVQMAQAATKPDCTPRSQCCKVCSKGKACGDSCISQKYTCRKVRGCACNGYEVCR